VVGSVVKGNMGLKNEPVDVESKVYPKRSGKKPTRHAGKVQERWAKRREKTHSQTGHDSFLGMTTGWGEKQNSIKTIAEHK